jgi:hypothetical protein
MGKGDRRRAYSPSLQAAPLGFARGLASRLATCADGSVKSPRTDVLRFAFIVFSVMLDASMTLSAGEPVAAETADSIMRKMVKAYGDASSYQDEGVTLSHDPAKPGPDQILFATLFKRPNFFRFDWTSHHPHPPLRHLKTYAVTWADGTKRLLRSDAGD